MGPILGGGCHGIFTRSISKKERARTVGRPHGQRKGTTMNKVYHKNAWMSSDVRQGAKEFMALCALANEVYTLYGIGSIAAGYGAPDFLPYSIGIGFVTIAVLIARGIYAAEVHGYSNREKKRHGVITPEEICHAMKRGRR